MNTGEHITVIHQDGHRSSELLIWCDICGYGARQDHKSPDQKIHFCHRHKEADRQRFLSGTKPGYFKRKELSSSNSDK